MTQLTNDIYAIEAPEGAKYHRIDGVPNGEHWELIFYNDGDEDGIETIDLPSGNWQLITTTKECTEEQARLIVKELPVGQRWPNHSSDYPVWWHYAKDSLRSLLVAKGLDGNKNYVLIKKIA